TREGKLIRRDIMQDYCVHVLSKISVIDRMKIVVDAGNAMAGYTLPKIFESLPVEVVPMYFKLDLSFPNHEANPLKFETLKSLQARVVEEKAQLGVAFDGDADRVFFVDEQGSIVPADFTTALLAEEMLKKHPGSVVLYDLRSSWVVREVIERHGGKPMMCRVGHAFIKQQMRANDAVFGGELSGHFYFKDNFYTESGVITMLRMMELMCRRRGKLSELVAPLKRYHQSGEINFRVSDREAVLAAIEKHFSGEKISHLDGVKIETNEYWVNIRPSNTEPLVRLTAEAKHPETLKRVVDEVKRVVEPFLVKEN
ncbi:phosphomannomutase/phosphoglucomutase, partial [Candidatus Woesearchaeota archaeon]|nr:phosphomannomutase/phosphoglucomutase [Candidatus Woesearchaeota archaeon]